LWARVATPIDTAKGRTEIFFKERILMKIFLAAIALFAAVSVSAQYVPATPTEDAMQTRILQRSAPLRQELLTLQPQRPNEIRSGRVVYSGIFVQMYKTGQPLQMVNPAASGYGLAEDNTVLDPISGRGTGLKLFAIQF